METPPIKEGPGRTALADTKGSAPAAVALAAASLAAAASLVAAGRGVGAARGERPCTPARPAPLAGLRRARSTAG